MSKRAELYERMGCLHAGLIAISQLKGAALESHLLMDQACHKWNEINNDTDHIHDGCMHFQELGMGDIP